MRGVARLKRASDPVKNKLTGLGNKLIRTRTISYYGFRVIYSAGTSIVDRYKRDGSYEEDVSQNLIKIMSKNPKGAFIDIGANVGLISLRVLSELPDIRIYAFEPGPHQLKLLRKTIAANALEDKMMVSDLALSNKKGEATFSVHKGEDASGDGFLDTERAGKTTTITVHTDTLDNWWVRQGKPAIDLIKIDTEGAEKLIVDGAKKLIEKCHPALCLEIWPVNLKKYPYDAYDIYKQLRKYGYRLETQDHQKITDKTFKKFVGVESDFIAYYENQ